MRRIEEIYCDVVIKFVEDIVKSEEKKLIKNDFSGKNRIKRLEKLNDFLMKRYEFLGRLLEK